MDNPDQQHAAARRLIDTLRKVTAIIRVLPFLYLIALSVCMILDSLFPEWACRVIDAVLSCPTLAPVGMIGMGRILKLCVWHRTACLLPACTKILGYVDSYIFPFTQSEIITIDIIFAAAFISFVALAYLHIYGRQTTSHRHPRLLQV